MDTQEQGDTGDRTPQEAVRVELERAIMDGQGRVFLVVCRPVLGSDGDGWRQTAAAHLAQITWAAVWDALALDPQDEGCDEADTELAARVAGGVRVLEVAMIDGQGCVVPATRGRTGGRR